MAGRRRNERAEVVREKVIQAAARTIGDRGYDKTSIARVAEEAGIAHGSVYLHFENRQALFDSLLPTLGRRMLDFIRGRTRHARTLLERERIGLEANFAYLSTHPYLHRLTNEAEFFAPSAHREFYDHLAAGYVRALRRAHAGGELPGYTHDDLEPMAYMLMGAREFLLARYCVDGTAVRPLPPEIERVYMTIVARALSGTTDLPEEAAPSADHAADALAAAAQFDQSRDVAE